MFLHGLHKSSRARIESVHAGNKKIRLQAQRTSFICVDQQRILQSKYEYAQLSVHLNLAYFLNNLAGYFFTLINDETLILLGISFIYSVRMF